MATPTPTPYRSPWTQPVEFGAQLRAAWTGLRRPGLARRILPGLRAHLGAAPASTAYAFTLFVTWWTLRGVGNTVEHRLIFSASTNLHNMREQPVQVLVASAFWTEGGFPWAVIVGFLVVMAYAERWLGTLRWIMVFATGHIGASLLTVTAIAHAIDRGVIPVKVAVATDVGSSYGFSAVLAALSFRFVSPARWILAGAFLAVLVASLWIGPTFTDYGHLCAAGIGVVIGSCASLLWRWLEKNGHAEAAKHQR
ncbi:rhomboid-like protein [Nocardia callitridis]|uniref:Rhomboid family intramembrane serine protease n=1 Tax=Nocardia callitridis TaxID=648753 RepID=A0ABP9KEV3_9NOCA